MAETKVWTSKVTLRGLKPGIMFDRYLGDNTARVANQDKMYVLPDGQVYIPSQNVVSLCSATNTRSAPKALYDSREYGKKAAALLGYLVIEPSEIVLTRGGEPIRWTGDFDADENGPSGIVLHRSVARLPKGIPNPKERPLILAPWEASFTVSLFENETVAPAEFQWLFEKGMMLIGLGTFRGVFGKATVDWS
jgi:hypothetical protein